MGTMQLLARTVLPLLPAGLAMGFIWLSFDARLTGFMPHYDVDQYIYWHEMATYALHGFQGGYYGVNEMVSPLKGFGPHGIGIVMAYGTLYGFMPWLGYALIPVVNVGLLTLALAAYVWGARPPLKEAVPVCLATALYPPLFLYLPTSFQEGFHYAAAVALALAFIRLVESRGKPGAPAFQALCGVFLLLLCFVRYTWAVCFLPYFFIVLTNRRWRLPLAVGLTLAVSLAVVWFFNLFVPAWYSAPKAGVHVSGQLMAGQFGALLDRASLNLRSLFDYTNNRAATAALSGILAFTALAGAIALRKATWKRGECSPGTVVFLLVAMNMAGLLAIFILAWTGSGSHLVRLLSANYIFCFIVVFHFFPWRAFHLLIAYNAVMLPMYMGIFQVYHLPGYVNAEARLKTRTFMEQVAPHLHPLDKAGPWGSTILVNVPESGIAYLGLPPGFGLQMKNGSSPDIPKMSRYGLLTSQPGESWRPVAETVLGTLYVNSSDGGASVPVKGDTP